MKPVLTVISNDNELQELQLETTDATPSTTAVSTFPLHEKSQLTATRGADGVRYIGYQLKKNKQLEVSFKTGTELDST